MILLAAVVLLETHNGDREKDFIAWKKNGKNKDVE
jgi:hypothetical protein